MSENVQFNIADTLDAADVDQINNTFYSRFNYPWVPLFLPSYADPTFWPEMLNSELGYWDKPRFGDGMKIWVGGCGTNQAVLTALKFPTATVVGSDVSIESLKTAEAVAQQLGLTNLTLRVESLNETSYKEEFDYVICTGVIHHNADPSVPLRNLMRGMKRDGVLELMVYNYYHRVQTTAFQKAIRILGGSADRPDIDRELPLAMQMVEGFPVDCHMKTFLEAQQDLPEAAVADSLLQPVEYSYTMRSLGDLAEACNLRFQSYCLNQFDKLSGNTNWFMNYGASDLQARYESLPELEQMQVTNLLLAEASPMLWFYMQRQDHPDPIRTQGELDAAFLQQRFTKAATRSRNYVLKGEGSYVLAEQEIPCPAPVTPVDPVAAQVFRACDGQRTIAEILKAMGMPGEPAVAARLRPLLTSCGHPYLHAVRS